MGDNKMKRVNKNDFVKAMKKFGLEPLVDTWKMNKDCEYDRWSGKSKCNYEYFINSKCGIVFEILKQSSCEPDVSIKLNDRNKYEQVNDIANYLEEIGYDIVDIVVDNSEHLIVKTINTIKHSNLFDDELNYIIDYVKNLNKEDK
jgi:hypothetical protein